MEGLNTMIIQLLKEFAPTNAVGFSRTVSKAVFALVGPINRLEAMQLVQGNSHGFLRWLANAMGVFSEFVWSIADEPWEHNNGNA